MWYPTLLRTLYLKLSCMFISRKRNLFPHIIAKIEGKKKAPGTLQEGEHFADYQKPDIGTIVDREKLAVSITNMASLYLKKAE